MEPNIEGICSGDGNRFLIIQPTDNMQHIAWCTRSKVTDAETRLHVCMPPLELCSAATIGSGSDSEARASPSKAGGLIRVVIDDGRGSPF